MDTLKKRPSGNRASAKGDVMVVDLRKWQATLKQRGEPDQESAPSKRIMNKQLIVLLNLSQRAVCALFCGSVGGPVEEPLARYRSK